MIARINHEHAEREKLEQARQELLKRKQALIAENNKRKDDLANLDQDLERFIDVSFAPFRLFPHGLRQGRPKQLHLAMIANGSTHRPQNRSRKSLKKSINLKMKWSSHVEDDKAFYPVLAWRYPIFLAYLCTI